MRLRESKQHTQVQMLVSIASESGSIKFPILALIHYTTAPQSLCYFLEFSYLKQQKIILIHGDIFLLAKIKEDS